MSQGDPGWVCPHCNKTRGEDGYDPCLGKLPGIKSACCGHYGKANSYEGYVLFETGIELRWNSKYSSVRVVAPF